MGMIVAVEGSQVARRCQLADGIYPPGGLHCGSGRLLYAGSTERLMRDCFLFRVQGWEGAARGLLCRL